MNSIRPSVTVIIPTYNRAKLLRQTIDSILGQTRPPEEVVVIDDGSTDSTAATVAQYGDDIRYLRQPNAGKPAALNHAIGQVESDYIWIMDDDDIALPDALETHLQFLRGRPDLDFSYSGNYEFGGDEPPVLETLSERGPFELVDAAPENLFSVAMFGFPFYMQGMLVPSRCYRQAGSFDESLTFTEDYDMILRLARRFRGARLDKPTFCFRLHGGTRGPAHERSPAEARRKVFREYEKKIFSKLHQSLPLNEYLPRDIATEGDDWMRQARLQRACVMSRHGLFDEAMADLQAVLDDSDDGDLLSDRECRIFARMLSVEAWWLREHPHYPQAVGRLLRRRRALAALRACAAGLGWRLEKSVINRQYADAMRIAHHLRQLIGTSQLPAIFAMALRRRYRQGAAL